MLKIPDAQQRKIPVAVTDASGAVVGATLQAEDTFEVLLFEIDQLNARASGLVARGFVGPAGFEHQPYNFARFIIANEQSQDGPVLRYAAFVEACGGVATAISAQQFLEYLAATGALGPEVAT